jgi:ATP-dependent Clp protease ATP-binding subunit ClpB
MVGQLMPIFSVASAIRRRQNGWYDANKPLVFLFLGSSGVGKTMLAKLLAEHVVKDADDGFIRIDMSEYQSKHEMARLIGSPPGYVGHDQGGQLTTKLAKCPEAVVLLDEVEKAHPDVLALMLQVFDEGRLTDGQGQTIHCPNAILIMTSNLVQSEIRNAIDDGRYKLRLHNLAERGEILKPSLNILRGSTPLNDALSATSLVVPPVDVSSSLKEDRSGGPKKDDPEATSPSESWSVSEVAASTDSFIRRMVYPILKRHFKREEFIGRINDIVVFHPLSDSDLKDTVNTELGRWKQKAMDRHGIEIRWTDALVDSLKSGYDERYGYRSIIYAVEKRVVNVLAAAHECEMIYPQCTVELDVVRDQEAEEKLSELPYDPILGSFDRVIIRSVKPRDSQPSDSNSGNSARKRLFGLF